MSLKSLILWNQVDILQKGFCPQATLDEGLQSDVSAFCSQCVQLAAFWILHLPHTSKFREKFLKQNSPRLKNIIWCRYSTSTILIKTFYIYYLNISVSFLTFFNSFWLFTLLMEWSVIWESQPRTIPHNTQKRPGCNTNPSEPPLCAVCNHVDADNCEQKGCALVVCCWMHTMVVIIHRNGP